MWLTVSNSYRSKILYTGFIAFCILTYAVGKLWMEGKEGIRIFGWDEIAIITFGLLGIYLAPLTGFPDLLDEHISNRQRILVPACIGIVFGFGDVALFKFFIHPEPLTALTPFMQPFPYSVLLYTAGALETEAIHRLVPIPLLMWLIGGFMLKNASSSGLFWILAVLTSLVEPYIQLITDSPALMIYSFLNAFAFNLIQAVFFRKSGFMAALFIRLGHYLIWHIAFGFITEYF
jgi:hypothetical protein